MRSNHAFLSIQVSFLPGAVPCVPCMYVWLYGCMYDEFLDMYVCMYVCMNGG